MDKDMKEEINRIRRLLKQAEKQAEKKSALPDHKLASQLRTSVAKVAMNLTYKE